MIILTIFMIIEFRLLSILPTGLSSPPQALTQKPDKMANTMMGSMFFLLISPEKSSTVSAPTTISPIPLISSISAPEKWMLVPAAGGNTFTTTSTRTPAMAPVITNTITRLLSIFPSRFMFTMFPTALDMETKTIGTTIVNIRFRKISPRGARTLAFSPNITPMTAPIMMPDNKMIGKR